MRRKQFNYYFNDINKDIIEIDGIKVNYMETLQYKLVYQNQLDLHQIFLYQWIIF